ncbi:unnamed protein product [Allacma fusca]|uniref:Uncharacterized protein n=1 Tax=Allacma fusca TaxID=39272 RepID=A0A8J2K371_9HEXA|nr:unnamed protein product [Allacma fusca]
MTLTLARIQNSNGEITPGSKGLSMFYLNTRKPDGSLNNIQLMKPKNKLGTRQLPTGEVLLEGTDASLVSAPGRRVATISGSSGMLTISVTRVHNTIARVAAMLRM